MIVSVNVVPNSKKFSLSVKDGMLRVHLKNPPENNRANLELVLALSKLTGKSVKIVSGHTSRRKKIAIDSNEKEWVLIMAKIEI